MAFLNRLTLASLVQNILVLRWLGRAFDFLCAWTRAWSAYMDDGWVFLGRKTWQISISWFLHSWRTISVQICHQLLYQAFYPISLSHHNLLFHHISLSHLSWDSPTLNVWHRKASLSYIWRVSYWYFANCIVIWAGQRIIHVCLFCQFVLVFVL